jgi:hypothetical protein
LKEATKSQLHLHKHTCTHTPLLDWDCPNKFS